MMRKGTASVSKTTASRLCAAVAVGWASLASPVGTEPGPWARASHLISDATGADGAPLCLVADATKPLVGPFTIPAASANGPPHVAAGPFYPAVVASCASLAADAAASWLPTERRELRVRVKGAQMCLSLRPMGAFQPLVAPFLQAFAATQPGSPFAYLADDLAPAGVVNARRADIAPELVVGACGQSDAIDYWVYDDPSGTISAPAGPLRRRACVALHIGRGQKPDAVVAGAPAWAAYCVDSPDTPDRSLAALDRASLPLGQRWRLESGAESPPTYVQRGGKDYFSGRGGLPITGPMGRCLTADAKPAPYTTDCDGRLEQDWKYVDNQIRLESKGLCLASLATGEAVLNPCSQDRNQYWALTVRDPLAGPDWLHAQAYGQLRPLDEPAKCLAVAKDPFLEPMLTHNALKLAECSSLEPRQTSWFLVKTVQTVRVELLRFGHSPDHLALPKRSDDDLKATFQAEMSRLSEQYRRLGVRFVFDPDHDFRHVEDKVADDPKDARGLALAIGRLAANDFYGKITVALTERGLPGGTTAWNVEYEPARIVDPVTGQKFDYGKWLSDPDSLFDKAGLPALSTFIDFGPGAVNVDTLSTLRQTQEFGRYFGLNPLNFRPAPADAPEDSGAWRAWIDVGAPPCGNLASLSVNGKTLAPDRSNAESFWGCAIGRAVGALTPMQLAKADWTLRYQLNRIPLTACLSSGFYDGDSVRCEDAQSFALCKETAAYLAKISNGAQTFACARGGAVQGAISQAMGWAGLQYVFKTTPQGQILINGLAGRGHTAGPVPDKTYNDVAAALAAGKNIPLARALLNRIAEMRRLATRESHLFSMSAFSAKPETPLKPEDLDNLAKYAADSFSQDFIVNAPTVLK